MNFHEKKIGGGVLQILVRSVYNNDKIIFKFVYCENILREGV